MSRTIISWLGFYHSPKLQASVGELQAKLEGQDVCYGTDVPLSSAAMPLSESHQLRWWMLTATIIRHGTILGLCACLLLLSACSTTSVSTDGGGTRGGNPIVMGMIVGTDGVAASDVRVSLITVNYDPLTDAPLSPTTIDTTDGHGMFTIAAPDSGRYNIEAVGIMRGDRLIRFAIELFRDSVNVLSPDTLHIPGTITIPLPHGSDMKDGHIFIPGTTIGATVIEGADSVVLDTVPAETIPALYYAKSDNVRADAIRFDIPVKSETTTYIENPKWSHCKTIVFNTTPSGAGVSGNLCNFPVLIRLNAGNFDFTQALSGGEDLMFTGHGNSVLSREIERWDESARRAEIWVKIDTIYGNNSEQSITMYWSNPLASLESESERVFDTADGFQGVWHLGDAENDTVHDATVNRYHGGSPANARPAVAEGMIGNGRVFDGVGDYITMPNTADGKLNCPQNGYYTVCAWVYIDSFNNNTPQLILSKGYEQYFLRATFFPSESPLWEFTEFDEGTDWQSTRSAATSGQWILLAGVRQGKDQFLYCNGVLVDSVKDVWPRSILRDTANDLSIGGFLKEVTIPSDDGYCFLRGSIDEARIISVTQSPDWIRLCYMNQRTDDRLVELK
jgi:hypothetical protein